MGGSTLYTLTWKDRVTPSGRLICALRASGRHISDNGSGLWGWPTASASDTRVYSEEAVKTWLRGETENGHSLDLNLATQLAHWNTPRATDGSNGGPGQTGGALPADAALAGWPTPTTTDHKGAPSLPYSERGGGTKGMRLDAAADHWLSGWPTPMAGTPAQNVNDQVQLAGWATPVVQPANGTPEAFLRRKRESMERGSQSMGVCLSDLNMQVQAWAADSPARLTASGVTLTGSTAAMESGGQLNPDLSRWLMGYPAVWGSCGAMAMQSFRKSPPRSSKRSTPLRADSAVGYSEPPKPTNHPSQERDQPMPITLTATFDTADELRHELRRLLNLFTPDPAPSEIASEAPEATVAEDPKPKTRAKKAAPVEEAKTETVTETATETVTETATDTVPDVTMDDLRARMQKLIGFGMAGGTLSAEIVGSFPYAKNEIGTPRLNLVKPEDFPACLALIEAAIVKLSQPAGVL